MVESSKIYREGILSQVKETFGKLVYSYTTHLKAAHILQKKNNILKWMLIIITAISTGGLLGIISQINSILLEVITAFLSTISFALTTFQKSASFESQIISHIQFSNKLWKLREEYISFLTDFSTLDDDTIIKKRNYLIEKLGEAYANEPLTNTKAYQMARIALKNDEEQFFSEDEINLMLPKHLRNK